MEYVENAVRYQDILKTSVKLDEHVRIIFGYEEELALLNGTPDEVHARREAITREIEALCAKVRDDEIVQAAFRAHRRTAP